MHLRENPGYANDRDSVKLYSLRTLKPRKARRLVAARGGGKPARQRRGGGSCLINNSTNLLFIARSKSNVPSSSVKPMRLIILKPAELQESKLRIT